MYGLGFGWLAYLEVGGASLVCGREWERERELLPSVLIVLQNVGFTIHWSRLVYR